ncbi:Protein of uncharacterised function (DUF3558) [Mycobacteroides abscessus subsp. abscessus]|uniref:DUF3558 domain-containing protein n=1 Tax=Mycobacteroides abscessus TaxID=36809 RepID=UPI000928843F|nr:DUF3558 domain-containing protein [Mycobacteroides abscessus]SIM24977.1 Protein of uncharacterised function (DUF3558) [Mycobacteroides abscessus subsp. abscessus]SLC79060.1 Protein of uncharacterised function (DUF3558) [Mycobacteroides abscessus subsp. abscessus]
MDTRTFAPLLVAVAAIASCSTTTSGSPAPAATTSTSVSGSSSSSTTSVSVPYTLTAPHPPPGKKNDGTSFDPCVAYTADEIRSWGVDPSKVEDIAARGLEYRGCNWSADGWSIEQGVINNPISDYLNTPVYPGSRAQNIGGLDGVVYQSPATGDSMCTAALPSQQATVHVIVGIYNEKTGRKAVPDLCAKAVEVATFVATKLPK